MNKLFTVFMFVSLVSSSAWCREYTTSNYNNSITHEQVDNLVNDAKQDVVSRVNELSFDPKLESHAVDIEGIKLKHAAVQAELSDSADLTAKQVKTFQNQEKKLDRQQRKLMKEAASELQHDQKAERYSQKVTTRNGNRMNLTEGEIAQNKSISVGREQFINSEIKELKDTTHRK